MNSSSIVQHNNNDLQIIRHPNFIYARNERKLYIYCIFHGTAKPEVTWTHNNRTIIADGQRIAIKDHLDSLRHTFSTLTILHPTQRDLGNYVCQGRVTDKVLNSAPVNIQIPGLGMPEISHTKHNNHFFNLIGSRRRRSLSTTLLSPEFKLETLCKQPKTGKIVFQDY